MNDKLIMVAIALVVGFVIYLLAPAGSNTPHYWGLSNQPVCSGPVTQQPEGCAP